MAEYNPINQENVSTPNNNNEEMETLAAKLLEAQNKNIELSNNLSQQGKLINDNVSKVKTLETQNEDLMNQIKSLQEQLNASQEIKNKYDALIAQQQKDEITKVIEIFKKNNVLENQVESTLAGIKSTYGIDLVANRNLATAETLIKAYIESHPNIVNNSYTLPNNGGYTSNFSYPQSQQSQFVVELSDERKKQLEEKKAKVREKYNVLY